MTCRSSAIQTAAGKWFLILAALIATYVAEAAAQLNVRVMAANTTSGNDQSYQTAGIRIFQGLQPDIVAIQEFRYAGSSAPAQLRALVDLAFGTNFSFYCEPTGNIPNGIVSRWPILAAGSWPDPFVPDRGFAWAQIDLPGGNDLYVVSVHLYAGGSTADRNTEATIIKHQVETNFPAAAWVIVGGDLNTSSRSEAAVTTFKSFLSDDPIPTDAVTGGNPNTNEPRNNPYDYVLPSFSMTNYLVPVVLASHTFSNGLVFDSAVYTPLSDVSPVQAGDSHVSGMQHMAVIKDFLLPSGTAQTNAPTITTQPSNQTVTIGGTATFNVMATGTAPLGYQWRFNGTNVPGANAATYIRQNTQTNDAGEYRVVVTNTAGSVTSNPALLIVDTTPVGSLTTLVGWDVSSLINYGPSPFPPTTNAPQLAVAGLTRGVGVGTSGTAAARGWGGNGFDAANAAAAVTAGDVATFTLAANPGYRMSFASVSRWDYRRSSTGPGSGVIQYQLGSGTFSNIATLSFPSTASSGDSLAPINLSGIQALQNVPAGTNVTFRIVNYGASGSGGTWYVFDTANNSLPDLAFQGTIAPVPPPATNPPAAPAQLSAPMVHNGRFMFWLSGTLGSNYLVQASTNLAASNWTSLGSITAPNSFTDAQPATASQKYYRAVTP